MANLKDIRIGTIIVPEWSDAASYIRQIIPYGFESFQIYFGESCVNLDLPAFAAQIKEAIGDADVTIGAIGIYGNPLENTARDLETRKSWEMLIDNACLFGTNIVSGFTGRIRGEPIEESIPSFKEVFGELAKRAADRGVKLAFENCPMGGNWKSGDWNIAHNPAAWELMFNAIPAENVGLEWEPAHQMAQLIDPLPQLRAWTPKIFHLHGKCCTIKWDVIRQYGIDGPVSWAFHRTPGFGDLNWTDLISDLRQFGYKGTIDIEGWHDPVYRGDMEMSGQVHGLNYLKACRGSDHFPNPV